MQEHMTREEQFEQIYQTYQHEVYKISLYYTKDEYIAQDIAQKAFYKFYLHFDNVNLDSVRSYLLRIARNLSYNWLRDIDHETKGEYVDNIPEDSAVLHSAEDEYIIEEKKKERHEFASEIMQSLWEENESWYDILNLIYCLDKSYDEAAKDLGISKDVLNNKMYRAKRWIRKHFGEKYAELRKDV